MALLKMVQYLFKLMHQSNILSVEKGRPYLHWGGMGLVKSHEPRSNIALMFLGRAGTTFFRNVDS